MKVFPVVLNYYFTKLFFILSGADVNKATTNNDHTVLSLACAGGHLKVVELLLAHNADPSHKLKVSYHIKDFRIPNSCINLIALF